MNVKILSVKTSEKKSSLITLHTAAEDKREKYTISEGTYREIGCPLSGEYIDDEALLIISLDDEKRRALSKALSLLSYSDNTEKNLYMKLVRSGFSKDAAKETTEECVRLGYIDEQRQAENLILRAAEELLGPYKTAARLINKGYSSKLVFPLISRLQAEGKVDFKQQKRLLLEKKSNEGMNADEIKKLLRRYGYIR